MKIAARRQRRLGKLSTTNHRKVLQGLKRKTVSKGAYNHACGMMISQAEDRFEQIGDWWGSLVDWLVENWEEVLKVLFMLLMIVIEKEEGQLGPLHIEW